MMFSLQLTGQVMNGQHQPVVSVKVVAQSGGKDLASAVTDASGHYKLTLEAGQYVIRVEGLSKTVTVDDKAVSLDFDLPEGPQFFDEPQFTVAGVTDNTYRGGHGSDTVLRSAETLTKETAALSTGSKPFALDTVKEFQKAAELNPTEANLFDWGTELLSHNAPQAAAAVFSRGNSQRMILGQAAAWYAAGIYDKAAHCFFEAIDTWPDDPAPYAFLFQAKAQEIVQSPGYAERFARYAQAHPENALANYYAGFLVKAVTIDPHLAAAQLALGIEYSKEGKWPEAISALQMALRDDSGLEEAHFRLSEAYRVTGEREKSREELATFQALKKASDEKLEKERRDVRQFVIDLKHQ
jgi:tetratricopeptide (TPR) repeat protein